MMYPKLSERAFSSLRSELQQTTTGVVQYTVCSGHRMKINGFSVRMQEKWCASICKDLGRK